MTKFINLLMKTQDILGILNKQARVAGVILNLLIGGFNYRAMKRKAFYPTLPDFSEIKNDNKSFERQKHNLYSLLQRLEKQGLVKKNKKDNKTFWGITAIGRKKLEKFKSIFHLPKRNYKKEKDDGFNIMIFDIPEKQRFKRLWLRSQLLSIDFSLLQKSVWIGKNKLPEEFLSDLDYLGLMDFIHIFKVNKTGTIKNK